MSENNSESIGENKQQAHFMVKLKLHPCDLNTAAKKGNGCACQTRTTQESYKHHPSLEKLWEESSAVK